MGRRSAHTPDELRRLILETCRDIIIRDGIAGVTAREIARRIGYSAGTLYNVFDNIDDLLLCVQTAMLSDVAGRMQRVTMGPDAQANVHALVEVYVAFAVENRRLWNLLFAHTLPDDATVPATFHEPINAIALSVRTALQGCAGAATNEQINIGARALWAGVHGITAIAVSDKGPSMTTDTATVFAKELATTYLAGFCQRFGKA